MARKKEFSKRILVGLKPWIVESLDVCLSARDNGFTSYSEVIHVALTNFLRSSGYWTVHLD